MSAKSTTAIRPEYDPQSERYTVHHDPDSSWRASTTVVLAIGALTGDAPKDMPTLSLAIDPEALDRLFGSEHGGAGISFDYHGHHVSVRGDGHMEITPLEPRGT